MGCFKSKIKIQIIPNDDLYIKKTRTPSKNTFLVVTKELKRSLFPISEASSCLEESGTRRNSRSSIYDDNRYLVNDSKRLSQLSLENGQSLSFNLKISKENK